jgi:antitoxin CptB
MIGGFVARNIAGFSEDELDAIEAVLEHWDVDLADWLSGRRDIPPEADTPMLRRMVAECGRKGAGVPPGAER